jgi:hypothetical protein
MYLDIPSGSQLIRTGGREAAKVADFCWSLAPALFGGLTTKSIYNWGVKYFKNDKGSWTITKTEEGAGAMAVMLFSFVLWRLVGESEMVTMFVAGMIGRGSIVTRNTFYRILGWQPPANLPDPDYIDVTPISANEPQAGLDDEMMREIGRYGLKNTEFSSSLADGIGRRMNEWLGSQGRPPIEQSAVEDSVREIFQAMSNRG